MLIVCEPELKPEPWTLTVCPIPPSSGESEIASAARAGTAGKTIIRRERITARLNIRNIFIYFIAGASKSLSYIILPHY
jgi:hypothetical protein